MSNGKLVLTSFEKALESPEEILKHTRRMGGVTPRSNDSNTSTESRMNSEA